DGKQEQHHGAGQPFAAAVLLAGGEFQTEGNRGERAETNRDQQNGLVMKPRDVGKQIWNMKQSRDGTDYVAAEGQQLATISERDVQQNGGQEAQDGKTRRNDSIGKRVGRGCGQANQGSC